MASKLYNGRILHRIVDITRTNGAHTLSQQGDSFVIFSMSSMSERLNEFIETSERDNCFTQWYNMELR